MTGNFMNIVLGNLFGAPASLLAALGYFAPFLKIE